MPIKNVVNTGFTAAHYPYDGKHPFHDPNHPLVNVFDSEIGASKIGAFVEIGGAKIGNNCSIGAFSFICTGVEIEDNCFIGPRTTFTNDNNPPTPKSKWVPAKTLVKKGARIGAACVICPGVTIGENCLIGAGSVVTRDTEPNSEYRGNPARKIKELS